ncbi:MAG: alanine racemase [Deltaproteobacteria bacterium]|nr:alanine racemase [Deltaproteobacteria bacterium]
MIISPNRLTIDLDALNHNLKQIKTCLAKETKIMGIVKSDAYGHGMVPVSKALVKNGVYCLGVSFIGEALELRKAGIRVPIIILCGIETDEEAEAAVENALTPVVFDLHSAEKLEKRAMENGRKIKIHVKIDTGMGRLGVDLNQTAGFLNDIMKYPFLETEGLMSHLSSADEEDRDFTQGQIEKFKIIVEQARRMGMDLKLNHLANSAGAVSYKDSHFDMVRPGIMLYGGLPSPGFKTEIKLKPVMGLISRVLQVRRFKDNTPVSYSRTYYTAGEKEIAIISAGYADGIPRCLSNRGKVLVGGKPADITGNVCMNMIACDVTGIGNISAGDECVILGSQGDEAITADSIAGLCNTISYEILLSMGRSLEREYI